MLPPLRRPLSEAMDDFAESRGFWSRFSSLKEETEAVRAEMRKGRRLGGLMDAGARASLLQRANALLATTEAWSEEALARNGGIPTSGNEAHYRALPTSFAESIARFIEATDETAVAAAMARAPW